MTLGQMWHSAGGVEVHAPEAVERPRKRIRRAMLPPPPMRLAGMDWGGASPLLMMRGIGAFDGGFQDSHSETFSFLRGIGSIADEQQWPAKRRPRPHATGIDNDVFLATEIDGKNRCQPCLEATVPFSTKEQGLRHQGPASAPASAPVPLLPAGTLPSSFRRKRCLGTMTLRETGEEEDGVGVDMEGLGEDGAMQLMSLDGPCSCSLRGLSFCMCDAFLHDGGDHRESKMMEYCTELDYCGWEACNYDI